MLPQPGAIASKKLPTDLQSAQIDEAKADERVESREPPPLVRSILLVMKPLKPNARSMRGAHRARTDLLAFC